MGITFARGSVIGKSETREYDFLVDTGSTWMTLPAVEITELALPEIIGGDVIIETPTEIIHRHSYWASGTLEGVPFEARIVPASRPMVGYELLQKLGFVVDLVAERIVLRTEWYPDAV